MAICALQQPFRVVPKPVVDEVLLAAYRMAPIKTTVYLEKRLPKGAGIETDNGTFYLATDVYDEVCRIVHEAQDMEITGRPPSEDVKRIVALYYSREKQNADL